MNPGDPSDSESISIMIPARNAADTLPLAIQSCLAQSLPDFELVLVDHGSTDNTFSIMKKYARRDSRIRVRPVSTQSTLVVSALRKRFSSPGCFRWARTIGANAAAIAMAGLNRSENI